MSTEIINEENSSWNGKRDEVESSVANIMASVYNLKICDHKVEDSLEEIRSDAQEVIDADGDFKENSENLRMSLENFSDSFTNNYDDIDENLLRNYFLYDNDSAVDNDFPTDFPTLRSIVSDSIYNIYHYVDFDNEADVTQLARLLI